MSTTPESFEFTSITFTLTLNSFLLVHCLSTLCQNHNLCLRVKWGSKCLKSTCSWKKNLSIHWRNCPLRIVLQNRAKILLKFSDLSLMCTSELCLLPFDTLLWFSHFTHAFLIGSSDFQIFSKILICNARDDDLVYLRHIHLKWSLLQDTYRYILYIYIWGQKSKWDLLLFCDYNWINF